MGSTLAQMASERELLIVGGGRMGEALLGGLLAAGRDAGEFAVAEVSRERRDALEAAYPGVTVSEGPVSAAGAVLAVKPGIVPDAARAAADAGARRFCRSPPGSRRRPSKRRSARRCRWSGRCRTPRR